jgi:two-component system sensor histidine kinase KdpD
MLDERPDPIEVLLRLKDEEAQQGRGRLKIFFGFSAGVGKTYSMLQAASKLKQSGVDVVVGFVETHGRAETAGLLSDLEVLPRAQLSYRGGLREEFDIDLALTRKPALLLVDELAHTNIPGSRHAKRWQDVQELLENGIDVFTSLNVQHIESLHDVVCQITGVHVHERVPDLILDGALEIELVDLPPDELIQRLKDGKVYLGEKAADAMSNFFRKGNLIALRELALRYTAQHVEKQMLKYRQSHMIKATWPATDSILVCVSASPLSVRLVRAARRMADALKAKWVVAFVETPSHHRLSDEDKARIFKTLRLAEELGAEVAELTDEKVAPALTRYARQHNVSKIIIGKTQAPRWVELYRGSLVDEIVRLSGDIDVYVITGDGADTLPLGRIEFKRTSSAVNYLKASIVVLTATAVAAGLVGYLETSNLVMIYILAVVIVSLNFGRGPAVLTSFLSVAVFDFCFVPPFWTFAVTDTQYLVTFAVMLTIALVISTLTTRVRQQADAARDKERRTASLYSLSKDLSSSLNMEDLISLGLKHVSELFECKAALAVIDGAHSSVHKGSGASALDTFDLGVASWVFKNKQPAGLGTATLPGAGALYLPLIGSKKVIGVLAVLPVLVEKFNAPEQFHLLETFANQMAVACERASLSLENEQSRVLVKTEQLRNSLLSSVSHDLRTPLATIAGAASSIVESSGDFGVDSCKALAREIYDQAARLNRLVTNLLDMTRLQSGQLKLNQNWLPADEIIGSALSAFESELSGRAVKIELASDLPLVFVDAVLIQQVMLNLLENAIKYSPAGTAIDIAATSPDNASVLFSVADRGPGVSEEHRLRIFDKFYRNSTSQTGVGLGLSICSGIIEAHDGKIWVDTREGGGSVFKFLLPAQNDLLPDAQLEKTQ